MSDGGNGGDCDGCGGGNMDDGGGGSNNGSSGVSLVFVVVHGGCNFVLQEIK